VRHLRDVIAQFFPELHPDPVSTTIGIEGYTTDGLALLGTSLDTKAIVVACGFSGSGFKFAPVMGDIAADHMIDGTTVRDAAFLAPDRRPIEWPPESQTPA
jgi:sarcosine oxidase